MDNVCTNITIVVYLFHGDKLIIKQPFKIAKETDKCFFTESGCRYLKNEIGTPCLKSTTQYPYIELVMVDASEKTLKEIISKWFVNKANKISQ